MKKARRVTGNDVTQAGGLIALIDKLVDQAKTAKMDEKERASGMLHSLTGQPSGLDPKQTEPNAIIIARRRGIIPLVTLVSEGSTVAQLHACGALANIAKGKQEYQQQIFEAGGVTKLVEMLSALNPKGRGKRMADLVGSVLGLPTTPEPEVIGVQEQAAATLTTAADEMAVPSRSRQKPVTLHPPRACTPPHGRAASS